jgi:hypothetical protein
MLLTVNPLPARYITSGAVFLTVADMLNFYFLLIQEGYQS